MATNPKCTDESARNWPSREGAVSEEAFHELERLNPDRKYEYIAGVAYMMSGGSVAHERIAYNVRSSIDSQLRSGHCVAFGSDVQVLVGIKKGGRKHYMYPDATVSCNTADNRPENTLIKSPRVVIEVLSPGTEAKDRGVKLRTYQKCPTIQEIVLVNQYIPYVDLWQRDAQNVEMWNHRYYTSGEVVEFDSINVRVEIEELYRGLNLEVAEDEDDEAEDEGEE